MSNWLIDSQQPSKMLTLIDLPPCVLTYIWSFCDATTLYQLSRTCTHFRDQIESTKFLWRYVDGRHSPNSISKLNFIIDNLRDNYTEILHLHGCDAISAIISPTADELHLRLNKLQTLTVLALENITLSEEFNSIVCFPRTLHELSLKNTHFTNDRLFFHLSSPNMQNLRVLILDNCHWLSSEMWMSVSKYENLEILSVNNCGSLHHDPVYIYMGSALGFRSLKVLDARCTLLAEYLTECFNKSRSILAIYLQALDYTYKLDYLKLMRQRKQFEKDACEHFDDKHFDFDMFQLYKDFLNLENDNFRVFTNKKNDNRAAIMPQSVLYKDPYGVCKCGEKTSETSSELDAAADLDTRITSLENLIETKQVNRKYFMRKYPKREASSPPASSSSSSSSSSDNEDCAPPAKRFRHNDRVPHELIEANRRLGGGGGAGPSGIDIIIVDLSRSTSQQLPQQVVNFTNSLSNNPNQREHYFGDIVVSRECDRNDKMEIALKRLSVRGYFALSDKLLDYLKYLNLDVLDLTYTQCTKTEIDKFLLLNPNCRIVHKDFCTCITNLSS